MKKSRRGKDTESSEKIDIAFLGTDPKLFDKLSERFTKEGKTVARIDRDGVEVRRGSPAKAKGFAGRIKSLFGRRG